MILGVSNTHITSLAKTVISISLTETLIAAVAGAVIVPIFVVISHFINQNQPSLDGEVFELRDAPKSQMTLLYVLAPLPNIFLIWFSWAGFDEIEKDVGMFRGTICFLIITVFYNWVCFRYSKVFKLTPEGLTVWRWGKRVLQLSWQDIRFVRKTLWRSLVFYNTNNKPILKIPLGETKEEKVNSILQIWGGFKIEF